MSDHSRRNFLRTIGLTTTVGVSGCLRLTDRETGNQASTDSRTPTPTTSGTQTSGDNPNVEDLFEELWQQTNRAYDVDFNNGHLYSVGSTIQKINASDGSTQWWNNPRDRREGIPANNIIATDGNLFQLSSPDPRQEPPEPMRLFNIDPVSGEQRWYFEGEFTEWQRSDIITASDSYVAFFESRNQNEYKLYCFDSESNVPLWTEQYTDQDQDIDKITIQNDKLFSVGDRIQIFDIETGDLLQTASKGGDDVAFTNTGIYVGVGSIEKLTRTELSTEWTFEPFTAVVADPMPIPNDSAEEALIVPTDAGVHCVDTDTGESKWDVPTTTRVRDTQNNVAYINGLVWAWDTAGILYIINSESGQLYYRQRQKEDGSDTSQFITIGDRLYSVLYTDRSDTLLPYGTSALEVTNKFT